jgi:hypothetical protein
MAVNAFELNLTMDEYLLNPSERPKIQFRSILDSQKRLLEAIQAQTDERQEIIRRIRQNHESIGPLFNLLVTIHEAPVAGRMLPLRSFEMAHRPPPCLIKGHRVGFLSIVHDQLKG